MTFPGENVSYETLSPVSSNTVSNRDGFNTILDVTEETVHKEVYVERTSLCEHYTKIFAEQHKTHNLTLILFAQNLWLRGMTQQGEGLRNGRRSTLERNWHPLFP